ncbi:hypothetical protein [Bradyrhizobium sp. OAE829]|uniref:hypothetical protein n=1 Tax=Bradyrhizobium sp. OAE829 TaxID=2663807 RepID=UPI0019EA63D5
MNVIDKNLAKNVNGPAQVFAKMPTVKVGTSMFGDHLEDHGLPLVQLKERRRDMIVALLRRTGPIKNSQIAEIARIQQTIAAAEAVIVDLDTELVSSVLGTRCKRQLSLVN